MRRDKKHLMHDLPLYIPTDSSVITDLIYNSTSNRLICISSGGPVDSVTWMRNGATITANSSIFTQSQIITNATFATYHNILTSLNSSNFILGNVTCAIRDAAGKNESQTFNGIQHLYTLKIHNYII